MSEQTKSVEGLATPLRLCIERHPDGTIFLIAFDPLTRDTVNGQEGVIASVLTKKRKHAALIVTAVNEYDSTKARVEKLEAALKAIRTEVVVISEAIWAQEVSSAGILHDVDRTDSASGALVKLRELIRAALTESHDTKEGNT